MAIVHGANPRPALPGSREAFGARLRARRERAGVTLKQLANSTKVSAWMFEALEDGDISRWPAGLYRRAFFKQYVDEVGLSGEDMAEFERVFADAPPPEATADLAKQPSDARADHVLFRALIATIEWLTRKLSTA